MRWRTWQLRFLGTPMIPKIEEHHHTPRSKPVLTNSVQAVSNGQVDPASDSLVLAVQNVFGGGALGVFSGGALENSNGGALDRRC